MNPGDRLYTDNTSYIRLGICQKIYTTLFSAARILHTENAYIETIFASNKQQKCIIISNLALFWLKLNKMCNFFNGYEESLHLGVGKLTKYVRNCVVFCKKNSQLTKTLQDRRSRRLGQISILVSISVKFSIIFVFWTKFNIPAKQSTFSTSHIFWKLYLMVNLGHLESILEHPGGPHFFANTVGRTMGM